MTYSSIEGAEKHLATLLPGNVLASALIVDDAQHHLHRQTTVPRFCAAQDRLQTSVRCERELPGPDSIDLFPAPVVCVSRARIQAHRISCRSDCSVHHFRAGHAGNRPGSIIVSRMRDQITRGIQIPIGTVLTPSRDQAHEDEFHRGEDEDDCPRRREPRQIGCQTCHIVAATPSSHSLRGLRHRR